MAEPDENPFGDPTVGHPFQVTMAKQFPNVYILILKENRNSPLVFIVIIFILAKSRGRR